MDSTGESTSLESGRDSGPGGTVRTFLIADLRGYTRFTDEHGDEEAAALTTRFATLARETVVRREGQLLELRGDEACCAFLSARQAFRAALDLQRELVSHESGESKFPLGLGIGIDTGEAVPVEGGFRGSALNLAARLCSAAQPGQTLASESAAHVARQVEGVRLLPPRLMRLKGLSRPVRVVEIVPEEQAAPSRRLSLSLGLGLLALIAAAIGAFLVFGRDQPNRSSGAGSDRSDSAAAVDPPKLALGHSIGSVALGMGEDEVRERIGEPDSETNWTANGKTGTNAFFSPHGHLLSVSFFDGKAVQLRTRDGYYVSPEGIHVGIVVPNVPAYATLPGQKKEERPTNLPPGVEEVRPGVYAWHGFVQGSNRWCTLGNGAITLLQPALYTPNPGSASGQRIKIISIARADLARTLWAGELTGSLPC